MRLLITAGPTHEAIDEVRYLANRSSGTVGLLLAEAAADRGCEVMLLLGPIQGEVPRLSGVRVVRYESAADLGAGLEKWFPQHDVLIMAAAVADYRPVRGETKKIERSADPITLTLEPVPDLVAGIARGRRADQRVIAFALEQPEHLLERAAAKLTRKAVDAIVANPLKTMSADEIEATLLLPDGTQLRPAAHGEAVSKATFGRWLIDWILKTDSAASSSPGQ